jgi:hypothetical protein
MRTLLVGVVGVVTACALLSPTPAQAWHDVGHMAVALIAYRNLDDTQQKALVDVLKRHPHFEKYLSKDGPADPDKLREWIVMRAAIWPDFVRHPHPGFAALPETYHHEFWHFSNGAIRMFGDASPALRAQIEANIKDPEKNKGEVLSVLPKLLAAVKDPAAAGARDFVTNPGTTVLTDEEARAVALCWVLHLVGDIHQPLHSASAFTPLTPEGDRGGNRFIIRRGDRTTDLHTLWDGGFGWDDLMPFEHPAFAPVDVVARDLVSRIKPTQQELDELNPETWVDESLKLAETKAYRFNGNPIPGVFVGGHGHAPAATALDPLPAKYVDAVKLVAEQRVTVAGFRLRKVLAGVLN